MKFKTKYQILLWKSYFDKGLGLLYYVKYFIALFALASQNVTQTLIIAAVYCIFGFFLGWFWFKYDWITAEIEVGNRYNLFVEEMRERFKRIKNL